jgi:hypothetical protein
VGPQDHGRVKRRAVDERAVKVEYEQGVPLAGLVEQGQVQARGEAVYVEWIYMGWVGPVIMDQAAAAAI